MAFVENVELLATLWPLHFPPCAISHSQRLLASGMERIGIGRGLL